MNTQTRPPQAPQPTLSSLAFKRLVAEHWRVKPAHNPDYDEDERDRPTPDLHLYETFTPVERARSGTSFVLRADWLTRFNPHGLEVTQQEALHALCGQLNALLPSLPTHSADRTLDLHLRPLTAQMISQARTHGSMSDRLQRIMGLVQRQAQENDRIFRSQMAPLLAHNVVIATLNHHFQTVPDSPLRLQWAQRPDDLIVLSPAHAHESLSRSGLPWGEIGAQAIVAASPEGVLTPFMGHRDLTPMFISRALLLKAQTDPEWTLPITSEAVQRSDVDAARPLTLRHLRVTLPDQTPGEATLLRGETPLIRATLEGHTLTALDWLEAGDGQHPGVLAEALLTHLSQSVTELDHALTGEQAEHWFRYWALA